MIGLRYLAMAMGAVVLTATVASAQAMPADYRAVLSALGKTGDFEDGVLKGTFRGAISASPSINARHRRRSGSVDRWP